MTMTLVRADYLHKVGQHFTSSSAVTVPVSARSSAKEEVRARRPILRNVGVGSGDAMNDG
jgi:hypothetical protein